MIITRDSSLLAFNTFNVDAKTDFLIEYDLVADLQNVLQSAVLNG